MKVCSSIQDIHILCACVVWASTSTIIHPIIQYTISRISTRPERLGEPGPPPPRLTLWSCGACARATPWPSPPGGRSPCSGVRTERWTGGRIAINLQKLQRRYLVTLCLWWRPWVLASSRAGPGMWGLWPRPAGGWLGLAWHPSLSLSLLVPHRRVPSAPSPDSPHLSDSTQASTRLLTSVIHSRVRYPLGWGSNPGRCEWRGCWPPEPPDAGINTAGIWAGRN